MNQDRAQALLASSAGAAAILVVAANRSDHPLEHFAEPRVSFWLAAMAADFVDPGREAGWPQIALREVQAYQALTQEIADHPAFAWWWSPLDTARQMWLSPWLPADVPADLDLDAWRKPGPSDDPDPVPHGGLQTTSTLRDGSSSEATMYTLAVGDYVTTFPMGAWEVSFPDGLRVREINGPGDWQALYADFPAPGGQVPDWSAVAEAWDCVHVTLGGALSCQGIQMEQGDAWAWIAEQTAWLRPVDAVAERLPDLTMNHNHQSLRAFPYDLRELRGER